MKNVMVINMGLKSIRCIIFNQNGRKLSSASLAINTAINDSWVEQDTEEWWCKAETVMRRACVEAQVARVDYVTVTASASCLVCVDKDGKSLGRAFMVSDKRAEEESVLIQGLEEFQNVKIKTGMDMAVSLMLPKILWVKRNKPDVFERTAHFLSPNDYMISRLCGAYVTDCFNALKYHYDMEQGVYPVQLLEKLQIPVENLPQVVDVGARVGTIARELAQKIGMNADAEVIVTSYDAICSFVGSGVTEEGEASDVSGTVTVFRALSKNKILNNTSKVYNIPFGPESARIVGGSNNLGGGLIEWVKQCYYQKEDYPYEIMEKDAAESEVGAKGLIFLPYLLGERAPLWDNNARGCFIGLERIHTRKDMTRAVFESAGFIDRDMVEAIEESGANVQSVRLSGGLARINLISQIKADILGKDVLVLEEFETTASGAAMMVFVGQNVYQSLKEVSEPFAKIRMIICPNTENHKRYKEMHELYKETYRILKPLFEKRVKVLEKIRSDKEIQIENL